MTNIRITKLTIANVIQLQKIGRQTFFETFSEGNSEENMKKYLDQELSVEKLSEEINDKNAEFYFARIENNIIGYLKINFGSSQTELTKENAVEIERIYVLREYQGKNAGQLLLERAMQIARRRKVNYVWLGVWEENPRAIAFYKKNGFIEFDKHVFKLGNDEQTDIMMKLELNN